MSCSNSAAPNGKHSFFRGKCLYCEETEPGYTFERGAPTEAVKIAYIQIRKEEFAGEFLENCIQRTRELYGLNEDMVKKLLKEMGYARAPTYTIPPIKPSISDFESDLERIRKLHTEAQPEKPPYFDPRTGRQFDRNWLPDSLKRELIAEFKRPEGQKTRIAAIKYFSPVGAGTWWISEYDENADIFYGIGYIHEAEYGYTSRKELRDTKLPNGLWIERDFYWRPRILDDVMREQKEKMSSR